MNRRQELSRKIYEAGFEPDPSSDFCWEILPKKIKVNIEYEALTGEWYCKKELQEIFLANNCIGYPIYNVQIKNTLQEALLEVVCWCIDNGHIKAVK
jgi:hypothetical protein